MVSDTSFPWKITSWPDLLVTLTLGPEVCPPPSLQLRKVDETMKLDLIGFSELEAVHRFSSVTSLLLREI